MLLSDWLVKVAQEIEQGTRQPHTTYISKGTTMGQVKELLTTFDLNGTLRRLDELKELHAATILRSSAASVNLTAARSELATAQTSIEAAPFTATNDMGRKAELAIRKETSSRYIAAEFLVSDAQAAAAEVDVVISQIRAELEIVRIKAGLLASFSKMHDAYEDDNNADTEPV